MWFFGKKPDPFLSQRIRTERFDLVPCGISDAYNLSWLWTRDKDILANMTFDTTPRSKVKWYAEMEKPNNYDRFTHAIIPHGKKGVIGLHKLKIVDYKSANVAIALHDRKWWGKDVFFEVRSAILDHFFESDRVERFQALVNARNFASVFNYRKLGFRCSGTFRRNRFDPATGTSFDTVTFEMLKEDWKAKRGGGDVTT